MKADQFSSPGTSNSVDDYIASFPTYIQEILTQIRTTIHAAAPDAEERISYRMPAFYQNGYLAFFAAYKKHSGFYPTPSGIEAFRKELAGFKQAKGSVQFPLDKPMPLKLIYQIIQYRLMENQKKIRSK